MTALALLVIAAVFRLDRRHHRDGPRVPVLAAVPGGAAATVHRARTHAFHPAAGARHPAGVARRTDRCQAGNPPYLFGLLFHAGRRQELLRSGVAAISTLLAMGFILDVVFQFILYRAVHPGAALVVGPILICVPCSVSRALTNRLAGLLAKKSV